MDNFASWVDAPTAELIVTTDESVISSFLREEIIQSQQFVSEKLDDSEQIEKEQEQRLREEKLKKQQFENEIGAENRRADSVRKQLTGYKNASIEVEKRLIALKKSVPNSDSFPTNSLERLEQSRLELISIKNQMIARAQQLENLKLSAAKNRVKADFKKWKATVLEAKAKYDKLISLRKSIKEIENENNLAAAQKKELAESIEKCEADAKERQVQLEKLNENNAELRAQLVQIESAKAKSLAEQEEKELESIEKHTKQTRESTAELRRKLEEINGQEADLKKRLAEMEVSSAEAVVQLLRKKVDEAKERAKKEEEVLKMKRLKFEIDEETKEIERVRLEMANNEVGKGVSLKREMSRIGAAINEQDRLRKLATKEHEQLLDEIARHRELSAKSSAANLNATIDMDREATEQHILPQVTPIQSRQISVDVISGKPLMTSTPRAPPAPEWRPSTGTPAVQSTMQTRAAKRLAKNAEKATKTMRKKK